MGDSKVAPIGDLAVDPFDEKDINIESYLEKLRNVLHQCKSSHFGFDRTILIRYFNYSYMHHKDIRKPSSKTSIMFHMRKDLDILDINRFFYLSMVLDFCLTTDITSKLGMSVDDFMNLDLATFNYIKRRYDRYKPMEQEAAGDILKNLDNLTK